MSAYRTTDETIVSLAKTLKPWESAEVILPTPAEAKKFYLRYKRSIIRNSLSSTLSISRTGDTIFISLKKESTNPVPVIRQEAS
jgi:hypothetical protein